MPLITERAPKQRIPKVKTKARKRKASKLKTGRLWAILAGFLCVVIGIVLIVANLVRSAAGNPPQGLWGGFGVLLIFAVFACVLLDSTEGQNRWTKPR